MNIDEIRPIDLMERQRQAYQEDVRHYQGFSAGFVSRNCPACDSEAGLPFITKDGFHYLRCPACWCVFMSPGPLEDHLRWLYSEKSANYRFWAEEIYPSTQTARSQKLHRPRALWVQRSIDDFASSPHLGKSRRLLEFGAGTGDTLAALAQVEPQLDLLGFEPNPLMWQTWPASVELIKDASCLTALRHSISFITAFEVLEHLLLPSQLFSLASELLEPGGLLMLSTPNAASLEIQVLMDESPSIDIEHISIMTPSALMSLASRAGLEVIEIATPGDFDLELITGSNALTEWLGRPIGQIASNEQDVRNIQNRIACGGFSGHMKAIFRRI